MAQLPTSDHVKRAIRAAISSYNIRPGETFSITKVNLDLQDQRFDQRFKAKETQAALEAMIKDGEYETTNSPLYLKLTEKGYAALP